MIILAEFRISIDFREIAEIEKVSPPFDFGSDGGALYITLFDNILDERGNGIELAVIQAFQIGNNIVEL